MDLRLLHAAAVVFLAIQVISSTIIEDDDEVRPSWGRCPWIRNKLKNGRVKIRSRGRIAKFSCNAGYEMVGKRFATCVRGQWNNPVPICISRGCYRLKEPTNGKVMEMYGGALLEYDCQPGYLLRGSATLYCDGSRWSDPAPACEVAVFKPQTSCDFEDPDLCGWMQDPSHDFDWRRNQFETPSGHVGTGPSFDHTFGEGKAGFYMYEEVSSPRKENDASRLFSPVFPSLSSPGCFVFWYHMYGANTGDLRVYVKPESHVFGELLPSWEKYGDQGNQWRRGNISIPTLSENFQIIIEGIRGSGYAGDIAIDDVSLANSDCSALDSMNVSTSEASVDSCRGRCREKENTTSCGCSEPCFQNNSCCSDYNRICTISRNDTSSWDVDTQEVSISTSNFDFTSETFTEKQVNVTATTITEEADISQAFSASSETIVVPATTDKNSEYDNSTTVSHLHSLSYITTATVQTKKLVFSQNTTLVPSASIVFNPDTLSTLKDVTKTTSIKIMETTTGMSTFNSSVSDISSLTISTVPLPITGQPPVANTEIPKLSTAYSAESSYISQNTEAVAFSTRYTDASVPSINVQNFSTGSTMPVRETENVSLPVEKINDTGSTGAPNPVFFSTNTYQSVSFNLTGTTLSARNSVTLPPLKNYTKLFTQGYISSQKQFPETYPTTASDKEKKILTSTDYVTTTIVPIKTTTPSLSTLLTSKLTTKAKKETTRYIVSMTSSTSFEKSTIAVKENGDPSKEAATSNRNSTSSIAGVVVGILLILGFAGVILYVYKVRRNVIRNKLADDSEMRFLSENEVLEYSDSSAFEKIMEK